MQLLRWISVKLALTSVGFIMAFTFLPVFLITGQIEEFSLLIDEIFKGRNE